MLIKRSSVRIAPPKAPLPVADLHREEAPLEIVRDSKETLAVSIECRLLDWVSIRIPPASLLSSPPWSKWLSKTQATCSSVEVVSTSEESSLWDVTLTGAFPRSPLELACKVEFIQLCVSFIPCQICLLGLRAYMLVWCCWLCLAWIYVSMCLFSRYMVRSLSSRAYMLGSMFFHVYMLGFYLPTYIFPCLYV